MRDVSSFVGYRTGLEVFKFHIHFLPVTSLEPENKGKIKVSHVFEKSLDDKMSLGHSPNILHFSLCK